MNVCKTCSNPLDEAGFTNCLSDVCIHNRARFEREVEEARQALGLDVLAKIEQNSMPACFVPTRASTVALGRLLMQALRQNQELAEALQQMHKIATLH